jgi:hypothetical protein
MTSLRQIEANRRNAQKSTGPRSEDGKQRASRNAVRHGLTAETVIEPLEDPDDYKAFEQAVAAGYDAETAIERELILRLASLLWRLRRATSIETGLLQIQAEILRKRGPPRQSRRGSSDGAIMAIVSLRKLASGVPNNRAQDEYRGKTQTLTLGNGFGAATEVNSRSQGRDTQIDVARCFSCLADLDNGVFERLSRYEVTLWRQVRQTLFTLDALQRPSLNPRYPGQHRWRRGHGMPLNVDLSDPF